MGFFKLLTSLLINQPMGKGHLYDKSQVSLSLSRSRRSLLRLRLSLRNCTYQGPSLQPGQPELATILSHGQYLVYSHMALSKSSMLVVNVLKFLKSVFSVLCMYYRFPIRPPLNFQKVKMSCLEFEYTTFQLRYILPPT